MGRVFRVRGAGATDCELPNHPNENESPEIKTALRAVTSELAIEFGNRIEVKKDAEVETQDRDVGMAELLLEDDSHKQSVALFG